MYEFNALIPGRSTVRIELWDWNKILKDELIGYTEIDLEDRFFSKKFRELPYIPIETRDIKSDECDITKANLTLWCEIFE